MLRIVSPTDGELVAELPWESGDAVDAALERAHKAQRTWAAVPVAQRVDQVRAALARFSEWEDAICEEVSRQMGKPIAHARGELAVMLDRAEHMCSIAEETLAPDLLPKDGFVRRIEHKPLGVLFNIAAWNYPLLIPTNIVVPGLLAGNAVVLKHSPITMLTGTWFTKAFAEVGGGGLVQDLIIDHEQAARVIADSRIAHVAFTGSVRGGRAVSKLASERFIQCGLELGGDDPAYVRADADLDYAVAGIVDGACFNAGQSCCAVERVYVHDSLYDQFIAKAEPLVRAYQVGDPLAAGTTMGPLARRPGRDVAVEQLKSALSEGARLICGGEVPDGPGNFFYPALVAEAPEDSLLMAQETFAPIVAVAKVGGDVEAVQRMNATDYGLTASVWTSNLDAAEKVAAELDTGTVFQNRCDFLDPALPWVGVKDSGRGVTLSRYGILGLTRPKSLHFRTKIS